jgi:hypothetical protein
MIFSRWHTDGHLSGRKQKLFNMYCGSSSLLELVSPESLKALRGRSSREPLATVCVVSPGADCSQEVSKYGGTARRIRHWTSQTSSTKEVRPVLP